MITLIGAAIAAVAAVNLGLLAVQIRRRDRWEAERINRRLDAIQTIGGSEGM